MLFEIVVLLAVSVTLCDICDRKFDNVNRCACDSRSGRQKILLRNKSILF